MPQLVEQTAFARCCPRRRAVLTHSVAVATVALVKTRVTGICVENDRILLLDQDTDGPRTWSLPGGKVEQGETLTQALIREMREETGAEVQVGRLLYLCDHTPADVLHITFEVRRLSGRLGAITADADTRTIRAVEFVAFDQLRNRGISERFADLCRSGFLGAGSYMGPKANIGL